MNGEISDVDVTNEEIIIHPTAVRHGKGWVLEMRIIGDVEINGEKFEFNKVINVKVKPELKAVEHRLHQTAGRRGSKKSKLVVPAAGKA